MKTKEYYIECVVEVDEHQPIVIITHDKCTFFVNDKVQRVWTRERDISYK